MRRLYIHIGTHKTGTSSIQAALRESRRLLARSGIAIIRRFPATDEFITHGDPAALDAGLSAVSASIGERDWATTFIYSHEGLSGNLRSGYRDAGDRAARVRLLFQEHDLDTRIIVYLRRQDAFIWSAYSQWFDKARCSH